MKRPVIVLVHGMWHGPWAWAKVSCLLQAGGYPVLALTLPGPGRSPGDPTFAGHCGYLREQLDAISGEVVLVGHSYGGAVLSEVGAARNVRGMVFVSAFCLDRGETVADINDAEPGSESAGDALQHEGDLLIIAPDAARRSFYHDCSPAAIDAALARLTPEHASTRTSQITHAAWRGVPSHYVLTTEDRAITPQVQRRLAARVDSVSELPTSHSPMMSAAADLVEVIEQCATRFTTHDHTRRKPRFRRSKKPTWTATS